MGLVIIPCWRRPDFLAATLHRIQLARGARAQRYLFVVDRGFDSAILDVIRAFPFAPDAVVVRPDHPYHGPARNILGAYREVVTQAAALDRTHDFIGLIEEDVLVAEDIFEFWADALALDPTAFAVSACRNQNLRGSVIDMMAPEYHDRLVYRHVSFQSIGIAFRDAAPFRELVRAHARTTFYEDPIGYCARLLPDDGLPRGAASQDGLIHRVVRRERLRVLYPIVPRAFHAGWHGHNRPDGMPLDGSWDERARQILTMTGDQMNARADPRFRDIAPCTMIRPRAALKLV